MYKCIYVKHAQSTSTNNIQILVVQLTIRWFMMQGRHKGYSKWGY